MEKYFEVKKDSDFYKKYFDYVDMSDKVNELFEQFAKDNDIETEEYYQNTERLSIIPTQADRIKFKGMFVQNSDTDFKKTAPICKSWVNLCKENNLTSPRKPKLLWDSSCKLGSYSTSSRLFHIGEKVYGSIDNKCDADIELTDEFIEMKASEFWKIIEDEEESLLNTKSKEDEEISNKIEIVKYIVSVKLDEKKKRENAKKNAEMRQRLLEIKAKRQDAALENMSDEDLDKALAELE